MQRLSSTLHRIVQPSRILTRRFQQGSKSLRQTPSRPKSIKNQPFLQPLSRQAASARFLSTEEVEKDEEQSDYHSIIKDDERGTGDSEKREFQAETRKLLDIVAKSLYSGKEVFIRELISNCSDALEKLRFMEKTGEDFVEKGAELEIHIAADDNKKTFTIQDTGIGMTKDEMIEHLGTIAKSGSKSFIDQVSKQPSEAQNIIGQFGVGFYSTFMVADKVEVFSRSYKPELSAYHWTSDGTGEYEIQAAEGVRRGTKIVVQLKPDCYDYCKEEIISDIIKKYSNFVGAPIYLNGRRVNTQQAVWMCDPREVTQDQHEEFYKYLSHSYDRPRYTLHYRADAPLNIRSLFYVPEHKPTMFDMSRETDTGVALYSRKVMITPHAPILPKWLRFLKGVVDSEDVPLNLSREFMQDHNLIRKLSWVLTNRILKFLLERARKDPKSYMKFYEDYGMFFREGIVTTHEQELREDIAKLMRFESSSLPSGELTSLQDYCSRMKAGERNIFYLSAPNRELAESSPYYEAMKAKNVEVLFSYEGYDELVLMNLQQFDKKNLRSVENELQATSQNDNDNSVPDGGLDAEETQKLIDWIKPTLGLKIKDCRTTKKLAKHPCVVTVAEMGAVRHFLKTTLAEQSAEDRYRLLNATLEINPAHPIIKKLSTLRSSDPQLATLVTEQLYDNAMVSAGLLEDARLMINRLNDILEKTLEKH